MEKATFAAGCFWGVEENFSRIKGVTSTKVGYTGGLMADPGYYDVATGTTGHAESIEIIFDPDIISYEELLEVFWSIHDPTTKNKQGPDIGTQYRSAIFYHDEKQKKAALSSKKKQEESKRYDSDIKTEIVPASIFYPAEEYHQKYFEKMRSR
ncbi:methionine sulfoxide reductase A [Methanococcoides methylutens]|uniref:Peptide methionine sulfoxide reductase MsrA n=1 Tax=Methanococcoides methylutens TaxID=2226 RepID=A0A099T5F2_METMT|nr:peptide-methionine (S)-S-oxide reductase MsrA [Methanococcoides methylutens]KGK99388.1 methionine sulfoxide reductase A [Methanococcoides methylutens]